MRRRRHQLEVSTFPFLAVLLCTMGSLILLLLVLDRRAKIVAYRKAHEDAAHVQSAKLLDAEQRSRLAAEQQRLAEARKAEWERRQQQLHLVLAQEEQELLDKVQHAHGEIEVAGSKAKAAAARAAALKEQLESAQVRLVGSKQSTLAQQQAAANAEKMTEEARRELARQNAELLQLEQTLASLKALRQRQTQTYSVVPYFGKRGDNRRPLYVECSDAGLVFHPDRFIVANYQMTPANIREQVQQRIARQKADNPPEPGNEPVVPYLLVLVRPDGIANYYRTQQALSSLHIDFGYEFVESDWYFDFGGDHATQPWQMATKAPPTPMPVGPPPAMVRPAGPSGALIVQGDRSGLSASSGGSGSGAGPPGAGGVAGGNAGGNGNGPPGTTAPPGSGAARAGLGQPSMDGLGGPPGTPGLPQYAGQVGGIASAGAGRPGAGPGYGPGGPGDGLGGGPGTGSGLRDSPQIARASSAPGVPGLPQIPGKTGGSNNGGGTGVGTGGVSGGGNSGSGNVNGTGAPGTGASDPGSPAQPGQQGSSLDKTGGPPPVPGLPQIPGGQGQGGQMPPAAVVRPPSTAPENAQANMGVAASAGLPPGTAAGNAGAASGAPGAGQGASPGGGKGSPSAGPPGSGGLGGGQGTGEPSVGPAPVASGNYVTSVTGGNAQLSKAGAPRTLVSPPLGRLLGNREWNIAIECSGTGVVVKQGSQKFTLESLAARVQGEHPLAQAVRQMIDRRQAALQPGEPPYRPVLRFQVKSDGLRAYYLAYPLLTDLGVPCMRENVD